MVIKECFINKYEEFQIINYIINYLIQSKINYLYIKESKELHFDNYIIRFKINTNLKEIITDELFNIINNISKTFYNDSLHYKYTIINNKYKNNFKSTKYINNLKINTKPKIKTLKKKIQPTKKIYK